MFFLLLSLVFSCAKKQDNIDDIIKQLTPNIDYNYYQASESILELQNNKGIFINKINNIDLGSVPMGHIIKKEIKITNNESFVISNINNTIEKNNEMVGITSNCSNVLLVGSNCSVFIYIDTNIFYNNSMFDNVNVRIYNTDIKFIANIVNSNIFVSKSLIRYPTNIDFNQIDNATYSEKQVILYNNSDEKINITISLNDSSYNYEYTQKGLKITGCEAPLDPKQACQLTISLNGQIAFDNGNINYTHYIKINNIDYSLSANIIEKNKTFDNNIKLDIINNAELIDSSNNTINVRITNYSGKQIQNITLEGIDMNQYSSSYGLFSLLNSINSSYYIYNDYSSNIIKNALGSATEINGTDCSILENLENCEISVPVNVFNTTANAILKLYAKYSYNNDFDIIVDNYSEYKNITVNNTNILLLTNNNSYKYDVFTNKYFICPYVKNNSGNVYSTSFINKDDSSNFQCMPDLNNMPINNGYCNLISYSDTSYNNFLLKGFNTYKACYLYSVVCNNGYHINNMNIVNSYYLSPDTACIAN